MNFLLYYLGYYYYLKSVFLFFMEIADIISCTILFFTTSDVLAFLDLCVIYLFLHFSLFFFIFVEDKDKNLL